MATIVLVSHGPIRLLTLTLCQLIPSRYSIHLVQLLCKLVSGGFVLFHIKKTTIQEATIHKVSLDIKHGEMAEHNYDKERIEIVKGIISKDFLIKHQTSQFEQNLY